MSSDWMPGTLGDFIELKRGYDLPKTKRTKGSFPLVSSAGVTDWHDQAMVKAPGVVTGRYGTIGEVFYITKNFWPLNTTLYVRDFKGNDPLFISYFLKTLDFSVYSDKGAVPGVNRNHLHEAPVLMPPLNVQRAVANCLGNLDAAIETIQHENAALEAIAQTLFRSWFVRFDPVHAKAAGQAPEAMSARLASLFPSEFEESELGQIPKGWAPRALGDVSDLVKGRSYKSEELRPSSVALVTLKSFQRGGGFRLDGFKPYIGQFKDNQVVHAGECIVALTDVTQNADVIGRPAMVYPSDYKTVASLDVGILRPRNDSVTKEFLYCLLREQRYVSHILGHTTGTTVLHLSKDGIPRYKFCSPESAVTVQFTRLVQPLFQKIEVNVLLISGLERLRDHILPRLISGKLSLEEVQEAVEELIPA